MSLGGADAAHLLLALATLMIAAHVMGTLFARFRQPRVIGEIVGGLLLGPTLFGHFASHGQAWLFPSHGVTPTVLSAINQLGLLLLLFCSGTEIRSLIRRGEGKIVGSVFLSGMILPFALGLVFLRLLDQRAYWGPNGSSSSFLLVFAIAMAVTSIPVISKIMHDLGILETAFARIVLGVAVLEDIVLYVVLAVALGLAKGAHSSTFGLPAALGFTSGSVADVAYHVAATLLVLIVFLGFGPRFYASLAGRRFNLVNKTHPVAHQLLFMLLVTTACVVLGVEGFFGAFIAGIAVGSSGQRTDAAVGAIRSFSFAFFIPIYFAIVGLQLDLLHGFNVAFFLMFLVVACLVKGCSVYLGARVAGEDAASSRNLAVAMNARGGPGIVVASVAYGAGIVNRPFYAVLILLAIVTSLLAGSWLERVPRDQLLSRSHSTEDASLA